MILLPIAACLISVATGWCAVSRLWPTRTSGKETILKFCFSAGLGLGVSSYAYFLTIKFSLFARWELFFVDAALFAAAAALFFNKLPTSLEQESALPPKKIRSVAFLLHGLEGAAFLAVILFFLVLVFEFKSNPHGDWDGWAIWNLKARFLLLGKNYWRWGFSDLLQWSHPDYPLLLPCATARLWSYLGNDSPFIPGAVSIAFTLMTFLLLWTSLSILKGPIQASLAALTLVSIPAFARQGASQTADIPLGFFLLAALSAVVLAFRRGGEGARLWALAGLMAGCSAWTKNEGSLLALAIAGAIFLVLAWEGNLETARRCSFYFYAGLIPFLAATVIVKWNLHGRNDLFADPSVEYVIGHIADLRRHGTILAGGMEILWNIPGPMLLLAFAACILLMGLDDDRQTRTPMAIIFASLILIAAGYYAVYLLTPRDLAWHLSTSGDRLFLQLWPSMIFWVFMSLNFPSWQARSVG